MNKQYKLKTIALTVGTVFSLMSTGSALSAASTADTANAFTASTAATAASVNAKFTDVVTAVNDNAGLTDTNTADIAALQAVSSTTNAVTIPVDCSSRTLQDAIDNTGSVNELTLNVTGTCTADVDVSRNLILTGTGNIVGSVRVTHSRLQLGIDIDGSGSAGPALLIESGAVASLKGVTVSDTTDTVYVNGGSLVLQGGNTLTSTSSAADDATLIVSAGKVLLTGSDSGPGIADTITSTGTSTYAVELETGSSFVQNFDVSGDAVITGNVDVFGNSSMQLVSATVTATEVGVFMNSSLDLVHESTTLPTGQTVADVAITTTNFNTGSNSSVLLEDENTNVAEGAFLIATHFRMDTGSVMTLEGSEPEVEVTGTFKVYASGIFMLGGSVLDSSTSTLNEIGMNSVFVVDSASSASTIFSSDSDFDGANGATWNNEGELFVFFGAQYNDFTGSALTGEITCGGGTATASIVTNLCEIAGD